MTRLSILLATVLLSLIFGLDRRTKVLHLRSLRRHRTEALSLSVFRRSRESFDMRLEATRANPRHRNLVARMANARGTESGSSDKRKLSTRHFLL